MKIAIANAAGTLEEYGALLDAGCEVAFGRPFSGREVTMTDEDVLALCKDAHCYVSTTAPSDLIERLPDTVVAVISNAIGYDRIDVATATERGILVCNSPSPENAIGVAESTIGFMIALSKGLTRKERQLRETGWGPRTDRGTLLWRKTVGIVGLGRIGSAVAQRLVGWDVRLLAHAPTASPGRSAELGVTLVDLLELLRESDFVTLHVNAKPANYHLIGEEQLRTMRPSAYIVNMSRGEIIDNAALCRAIQEDWIAGAGLDVFEPEPLPMESPLRELEPGRLIMTPHTLSSSVESRLGNINVLVDNILTILRGEAPSTIVNPEVLPRWRART